MRTSPVIGSSTALTSPTPPIMMSSFKPTTTRSRKSSLSYPHFSSMDIKPGMTVRVHQKIKDVTPSGEEKERVQVFEGMVIAMRGTGVSKTMTVRKESFGVGVE